LPARAGAGCGPRRTGATRATLATGSITVTSRLPAVSNPRTTLRPRRAGHARRGCWRTNGGAPDVAHVARKSRGRSAHQRCCCRGYSMTDWSFAQCSVNHAV
jgi:hypothetical protein